jgi:hypothetical protein
MTPQVVGQLEYMGARDREYFTMKRPRWRIRSVHPTEIESFRQEVRDRSGLCDGCPVCASGVLVLASPSRRFRLRYFFLGARDQRPDALIPQAVSLLSAKDDAAWIRRLRQFAHPIGTPMGTWIPM